jgi:hypothetical protein
MQDIIAYRPMHMPCKPRSTAPLHVRRPLLRAVLLPDGGLADRASAGSRQPGIEAVLVEGVAAGAEAEGLPLDRGRVNRVRLQRRRFVVCPDALVLAIV